MLDLPFPEHKQFHDDMKMKMKMKMMMMMMMKMKMMNMSPHFWSRMETDEDLL